MSNRLWKALTHANRAPEVFRASKETSQWARITGAYLGLSSLQYPYVLNLRNGERICLQEFSDLKTFWQVFLRRVYRVQSTDRAILDLGANIGLFSLYAARLAPEAKIFALEPFPATFNRLVETVHDHQLETRVSCLNYAATGANGARIMANVPGPSQRRSLAVAASAMSGTAVSGKTLEAILRENNLSRVDLMKIDIEGSEYEVLLSTPPEVLKRITRIALEYHGDSAPYSKQQLFNHIFSAGFTVAWDVCDPLGYGVAEIVPQT